MDGPDYSTPSTPSETPSDIDVDQAVIDQSKKLEEMKSILKAQQKDLRQSLEALQRLEAVNPTSDLRNKRSQSASDCDEAGKQDSSSSVNRNQLSTEAPAVEKRLEIQICPICGTEFDNPENPDALEEHVAGHWCSSESSGIA